MNMNLNLMRIALGIALVVTFPAQPTRSAPPVAIELELVADGLAAPITLTHAGDGSGRLFIADQVGFIRIVENSGLLPTPFLDLRSKLPALGSFFDERGLIGLAFHPDYANNGRFFVRYSAPRPAGPNEPCATAGFIPGCHAEILAEYRVSVGDPNVADPSSEIILYSVDEPEFNHDAGAVAFGPDGFLYFSLGDGGGANDGLHLNGLCDAGTCVGDGSVCSVSAQDCIDLTVCASDSGPCSIPTSPTCGDGSACLPATPPHGPIGNGQNPQTALGSMLRIDVDSPPDPGLPYAIPVDNPFADGVDGLPETYAYGFRNPFTFQFDDGPGGTGDLYLGDVGQNLIEEVDIVVNGGNYGWSVREGLECFDPFDPINPPAVCPGTGPILGNPLIDPVNEYLHRVPCTTDADCAIFGVPCGTNGICENEGGISVIGGHVYRGLLNPVLVGRYIFGDFAEQFTSPTGRLYYFDTTGPDSFNRHEFCIAPDGAPLGQFLKGHGEDEDGEVYVLASDALAPVDGNGDPGTTGVVYRIVNVSNEDCNTNDVSDACEPDGDGDGVIDECDGCPGDPDKNAPGLCGCGVSDQDSDGDGTVDCQDGCPADAGKVAPGVCGCGVPDADSDGDGRLDCQDGCPVDPGKTAPGECGCGVPDTDGDGDTVPDCIDNCPEDANADQADLNGNGIGDVCERVVPAVSSWAMVFLCILLIAGILAMFGRRSAPPDVCTGG